MRDITNRSDPETGVDGCVERGGSRPCAGGVILWERALLAWGRKISLGEPAGPRAQDEKGAPDASTDAGVLPARCSSPPAVAAGRDGRPELTKSPPNSGAVRAQSADTSRRRLRPAGSSHEPALADGRTAARVEDSLRDPASPLPASDRVHEALVEPCPPRTGRLRRACRGTAHRSGRTGSGRSAARPRRLRRCASAAGAPPRRRARGRGAQTAQTLPAPPSAAPRRRASSAPQARISACRRGPDPQPECERVVSSGRRQWARSGGGCIFERGRAASSPGGALSGWPRQPEPRQTLKIAERSLGDLARRRPCRAESVERDHRPSAASWGAKGHLWPMSKAANSHSSL